MPETATGRAAKPRRPTRTAAPAEDPRSRSVRRRLARIEGQVRGIDRMVEQGRYCIDVLDQLAAVHQALRQVGRELLARHMEHCVGAAYASGDAAERRRVHDEIAELMFKYSR